MPREHQDLQQHPPQHHASPPSFVTPPAPAELGDPSVVYARTFPGNEPESEEVEDDAFEKVSMPLPSASHSDTPVTVREDRAPTADQMLDPDRPDLSNADADVVKGSTRLLVDHIYQLLDASLVDLKQILSATAAPEPTPFALKLISWAVENIATFAIGQIGKLAADELFRSVPALEPALSPAVPRGASRQVRRKARRDAEKAKTAAAKVAAPVAAPVPHKYHGAATKLAEVGAAKAGKALGDRVLTPPPPTSVGADEEQSRAAPGDSLLGEFITRQKGVLLARKVHAITTLDMIQASAARQGIVDLNERLTALLQSGKLIGWFRHKVTMEWLNFVTRASLGPRDKHQSTDMIGANMVDGIAAGGPDARQQWVGGDGFVEITLKTPDQVHGLNGVTLQRAKIPSSVGAANVLRDMVDQRDASGTPYNMATLPVFRRVWLQTGSSKLTAAPAFVITPDGRIEVDLTNPALAAIGAPGPIQLGEQTHLVGGVPNRDASEQQWARQLTSATAARAGAYMVRDMLRGIKPGSAL